MKNKQYYDNFFDTHDVNVHNYPDRFLFVSQLLSGKVLDIACGTGNLADYYAGDYVGVDISDSAIAKAQAVRRKTARFQQADFLRTDFEAKTLFNCVHIGEFLEHIDDDGVLFARVKKLLKPDGRIIASVPNGTRVPDESHCRTFTVPQIRKTYANLGKITFYNWTGAKDRIIFSIDLAQKKANDMSLVMIVKNEAKGIETAILSAINLVDNIVISVDSKTTDNTREIAALYADDLRTHEWQDDFSKARNDLQATIKTKWTLFLDGHEYVEKTGKINSLLALDVEAIVVYIKMETGSTFMYPRIFRSYLKFENAVHNALDPKTQQYAPKFVIVHDREHLQSAEAAKERERQRNRMIPQIMKARLKENPNDQRALFNLSNWYMTMLQFKPALAHYKRCLKQTPTPDERYFVQAQIGITQLLLGRNLRALFSFFALEKLIPDRWETKRLIAGVYMAKGMYKKAVIYLTFALEPNKFTYLYGLFGHDLAELWDLIASCYHSMNQPENAVIAWTEAMKHTKDPQRLGFFQIKRNLALMLTKNPNAKITLEELDNVNK